MKVKYLQVLFLFSKLNLLNSDIDSSNKEAKTTKNLNKKSSSHVSHKSKKSNYLGYLKKILPHQKYENLCLEMIIYFDL